MRHDLQTTPDLAGTQEGTFAGARWRYVPTSSLPAEQIATEVETTLTPNEHAQYTSFRSRDRRLSWLRGRIVAKRLIVDELSRLAPGPTGREPGARPPFDSRETSFGARADGPAAKRIARISDLDLVTRNERGQGIPNEVHRFGERLALNVSLSHTADGILAAVSGSPESRVGLDLTRLADVVPENLKPWLTPNERDAIVPNDSESIATIWAMKEAIYKAACFDEGFSPLRIEAIPCQSRRAIETTEWQCRFFGRPIGRIAIKTWKLEGHVAAIVVLPQPAQRRPFELRTTHTRDSQFARAT